MGSIDAQRPCKPVAASVGKYRLQLERSLPRQGGLKRTLRTAARHVDEWLRDYAPRLNDALVKVVMASGGIPSFGLATAASGSVPPVEFRPGDILLLADGTWAIPNWRAAVESARAAGTRIVPIIYDLLPYSHPAFFAPMASAQFTRWLVELIPLADAFVCISRATASALREFAERHRLLNCLGPIGVFPLGSRFVPSVEEPGPHVIQGLSSFTEPMLMVGTIEPRKNHTLVLDAFERLWQEGGKLPLAVIGRRGWQCSSTLRRFQRLRSSGHPFVYFDNATDADLQYAYRHARCLIYPSIAEGFGLPIVEALAQGLPVIASDIPVHREVGGNLVTYIPLGDDRSLAALFKSIESGSKRISGPTQGSVKLTTWRESAVALGDELDRLLQNGKHS